MWQLDAQLVACIWAAGRAGDLLCDFSGTVVPRSNMSTARTLPREERNNVGSLENSRGSNERDGPRATPPQGVFKRMVLLIEWHLLCTQIDEHVNGR